MPQLRATNSGEEAIKAFVVVSPDSELEFGDVPVRATTVYKVAPYGVYGCAAYRYKVGRLVVTQPVVDFVGAGPIKRARFTYRLELDSTRTRPSEIRRLEVARDE